MSTVVTGGGVSAPKGLTQSIDIDALNKEIEAATANVENHRLAFVQSYNDSFGQSSCFGRIGRLGQTSAGKDLAEARKHLAELLERKAAITATMS